MPHAATRNARLRGLFAQSLGSPLEMGRQVPGQRWSRANTAVVRTVRKDYLKLDEARQRNLHSDGDEAFLFQPFVNYRKLEFAKPLSTRICSKPSAAVETTAGQGALREA